MNSCLGSGRIKLDTLSLISRVLLFWGLGCRLESAAVSVGRALGKHVALAWLTARSAERERGKDLVQLIQTRFPDRIMRRRFERQIADIADQIAERLLSLCGHEYGGLGKNDKAAVLAEVVRALADADLSDRALFSADMDPVRLAAQVKACMPSRGLDGQLGEAGARLYGVVLDECCECLVRIVQDLPQFGPRASAETLTRLSGVANQISLLLTRLPARTLDAPEGTASDETFRRRYLGHISATLDVLELFGVRIEHYRPRTTLSVAYISLSVSTGADSLKQRHGARVPAGRVPGIEEWLAGEEELGEATLRVETALGRAVDLDPGRGGLRQKHASSMAGDLGGTGYVHSGSGRLEWLRPVPHQAAQPYGPDASASGAFS